MTLLRQRPQVLVENFAVADEIFRGEGIAQDAGLAVAVDVGAGCYCVAGGCGGAFGGYGFEAGGDVGGDGRGGGFEVFEDVVAGFGGGGGGGGEGGAV